VAAGARFLAPALRVPIALLGLSALGLLVQLALFRRASKVWVRWGGPYRASP
jgi:hypothetical protein